MAPGAKQPHAQPSAEPAAHSVPANVRTTSCASRCANGLLKPGFLGPRPLLGTRPGSSSMVGTAEHSRLADERLLYPPVLLACVPGHLRFLQLAFLQ